MPRFFQLSAAGQLHRMEAGHAGAGASAPIREDLLTLSKYELCNLPSCFGKKSEVGGALAVAPEPAAPDAPEPDAQSDTDEEPRRSRRISHGVQGGE